jgi:hypothetical protein
VSFPSSAFQLPRIKTILLQPKTIGAATLNDTTDAWNTTTLDTLYAYCTFSSPTIWFSLTHPLLFFSRTIVAIGSTVQLPSSINNLVSLRYMELSNGVYDSLPANLSGLVSLRSLTIRAILSSNTTAAFAPLTTIPNLESLLTSNIPDDITWIWNLISLKSLDYFDPFNPLLLDPIGNLVNLESLSIWSNIQQFPPSMAALNRLKTLRLSRSSAVPVPFPTFLSNFTNLEALYLSGYNIPTGVLPDLGVFSNLTSFELFSISGMVTPPSFFAAKNLKTVNIYNCGSLTSFPAIPDGGLPKLKSVNILGLTMLSQTIPIGFYNSPSMELFALSNMPLLSASISPLMGQWTNLKYLQLESAPLTGSVPTEVLGLTNLESLTIRSTLIQGPFVSTAGLPSLQTLALANNKISEVILNVTGTPKLNLVCVSLFPVRVSPALIAVLFSTPRTIIGNSLSSFPSSILQSQSVSRLEFGFNDIPPQPFPDFSAMTNLQTLFLRNERFFGQLPDIFDSLPNLQSISISNTSLIGTIPLSVFTGPPSVVLVNSNLTALPGSFPRNCTVESFYASGNSISGGIDVLSSCRRAKSIDLSNNRLGPVFAPEILNLPRLSILILQQNRFSSFGFTPRQKPRSVYLQVLLSDNNLSGPIDDNIIKTIIQYGGVWYATFPTRSRNHKIQRLTHHGVQEFLQQHFGVSKA